MTNLEKIKCEKALNEAISSIKEANELYKEEKEKGNDCQYLTPKLRLADNKRGYAEGINQVLVFIGYNSESFKELTDLL